MERHKHFAGRLPAGTAQPLVVKKNGVVHTRLMPDGTEQDTLAVGLACSECFSGTTLAKVLRPGFRYESRVMEQLARGIAADPLSIHTSAGVTEALGDFIEALVPHIPWKDAGDEWCVSLQLEGASAVWAAIDMLLQLQMLDAGNSRRTKVAVGAVSYHGPPSTSFGSAEPLWTKTQQVMYPVPIAGAENDDSLLLAEFEAFLDKHGQDVGVIVFEPQWGSSQSGFPWPRELLRLYIQKSKEWGILVVTDEVMCGVGRHGQGTLFLSEAWGLEPDAVTFGKAMGGGVYPLSGAILKTGRSTLGNNGRTVMQSHTYSGSSVRAFLTAREVLNEIPKWFSDISQLGMEMEQIFSRLEALSEGLLVCHGQGLMWGGTFTRSGKCRDDGYRAQVVLSFKFACEQVGILPYFVAKGGFMVTPPMDIGVEIIHRIGELLSEALQTTLAKLHWKSDGLLNKAAPREILTDELATSVSDRKQETRLPLTCVTRS